MKSQFKIGSKIVGHSNLVRPATGGGVVNIDQDEYTRAVARRRATEKQTELECRMNSIETKLDRLLSIFEKQT